MTHGAATARGRRGGRCGGPWEHRDFLKLWSGQTVSFFGSHATGLALPLTAALVLDATPTEMGVLAAAGSAPYLLLGLVAGVWVDRWPRRPVLIMADLGRAALLLLVPLLFFLDRLGFAPIVAVAFLVGTLTMLFDLAYQSYLPTLVPRRLLAEANGKLMTSRSVADIGGPGLAGGLVQAFGAPIALLLDAGSFLVSAASLALVRTAEPPRRPAGSGRSPVPAEIARGLRFTFGDALLRAGACSAATYNFFWNVVNAVLVLYAGRTLGMSPGLFAPSSPSAAPAP